MAMALTDEDLVCRECGNPSVWTSGEQDARAESAVNVWKKGCAPVQIFYGGWSDPKSVESAELMKRVAVAAGVQATAIVEEGSSATTGENPQHVAELMKSAGLRSAI